LAVHSGKPRRPSAGLPRAALMLLADRPTDPHTQAIASNCNLRWLKLPDLNLSIKVTGKLAESLVFPVWAAILKRVEKQ
jgi:hypothetical protein